MRDLRGRQVRKHAYPGIIQRPQTFSVGVMGRHIAIQRYAFDPVHHQDRVPAVVHMNAFLVPSERYEIRQVSSFKCCSNPLKALCTPALLMEEAPYGLWSYRCLNLEDYGERAGKSAWQPQGARRHSTLGKERVTESEVR
ncbi:MAG: hypothetical protein AAF624_07725 [Bacteroidota bacterium]